MDIKAKIIYLKKKEFERRYGTYPYGGSGYEESYARKPVIHIKKGLSKKTARETIEHETGHIFVTKKGIVRRIPRSERIRIVKEAIRTYPHVKTSRKRLEEALADFYAYLKSGTKEEKRYLRERYAKTIKIMKETLRKKQQQQRALVLNQKKVALSNLKTISFLKPSKKVKTKWL